MRLIVALLASVLILAGCRQATHRNLTFSTWGSIDEIDTLKPILAKFTKESGLPVELVHIPTEYAHKLRLMVAAGTIPDVMFIPNDSLPGFADKGVFEPLEPFLERDPEVAPTDYYKPVLDAMSWKKTLYAIPRDLSNLVVFYNKQIFDEAKVPYPRAGWTFDDLLKIAPKVTVPGERWAIGFQPNPLVWTPYVWSFGGDLMDEAMTRCTLMDPPALKGLQFYVDLRTKHHFAPSDKEAGNARMSKLFATGKLAMFVYGRWAVPGFRKKITFPWDVAPFPTGPGGSVVDADASGWAISKRTERKDDAWKLVKYLGGKESIAAFSQSGLIVPSRPDVAESPDFLAGIPEHSRVFLDVIASARPQRAPIAYDEITWELIDGMAPAWTGEKPLEEVAGPLCDRITALLREAR